MLSKVFSWRGTFIDEQTTGDGRAESLSTSAGGVGRWVRSPKNAPYLATSDSFTKYKKSLPSALQGAWKFDLVYCSSSYSNFPSRRDQHAFAIVVRQKVWKSLELVLSRFVAPIVVHNINSVDWCAIALS
jgi:hypothetical protein